VLGLLEYLKGKSEQEVEQCQRALEKIEAEKHELGSSRTWSLEEYNKHLETTLTKDNIQIFLEYTRCRHIFMFMFPENNNANWLNNDNMKPDGAEISEEDRSEFFEEDRSEISEEDSSEIFEEDSSEISEGGFDCGISSATTETQCFFGDLIRILKKVVKRDRNPIRLNFFNFLDLCWEALGFDLWGKGNVDRLVDNSESNKRIKPNAVRKVFIEYIKNFVTKGKLKENSGGIEKLTKVINRCFQGNSVF